MRAVPLSAAVGVELPDFDITRPCSPKEQAELRQLLCDHHLILVRSATMTDEDHDRFVLNFGPLAPMGVGEAAVVLENDAPGTRSRYTARLEWHNDLAFIEFPNIATSLWAQDVAPGATRTGFLNAVRALETLPSDLRDRIKGRNAVHAGKLPDKDGNVDIRSKEIDAEIESGIVPTYEHPIAYLPPHSDRRTLFVCRQMTHHIAGLPRDESDALLDALLDHLEEPENIYLHPWQPGDVIIWDNICAQHGRPAEVGAVTRKLRRLATDGWITDDGVLDWSATRCLRESKADRAFVVADEM